MLNPTIQLRPTSAKSAKLISSFIKLAESQGKTAEQRLAELIQAETLAASNPSA